MRTFIELVERYVEPELCPYPEYKGKPYYSIKYIENGEEYVGYSTYNLQVMSGFLKKYFMSSAMEKQEQDRWIPVTERLPETTDPVNVTWANNDPVSYYEDIRGKRFTATACYHRGKWWWYSAVCQDLLDEYGKSCMDDEIDEAIEILAWKPLPEPYQEDEA